MLKLNVQLQRGDFAMDVAFEQTASFTGVFGPSGAGKSTLMHLIAGLESPRAGRIAFDGETLFDSANGVNVAPHRRRIGVMFQDDRLFPQYTVEGNLRYGERGSSGPTSARSGHQPLLGFDRVVDLLALGGLLARRPVMLSGGERQRVALGRALLAHPRLLLLDEPLSSLDAGLKRQILPYLRKVRDAAGVPMLYVSHDLTEMLQVTDHLLLLENGRVVAHGPFAELAHDHAALESMRDNGLVNVLPTTCRSRNAEGGVVLSLDAIEVGRRRPDASAPTLRAAIDAPLTDGTEATVVIRAADIAIALHQVQGVSIQNQLPGEVTRLTPHGGRVIVEVDVGRPLLAELTPRAVESLALRPGASAWCLVKSNAVRLAT